MGSARSARWLSWLGLLASLVLARPALSEPAPKLGVVELAPHVSYEQQRTERLLAERKLSIEPSPQGKRIGFIVMVRDEVFAADELWPLWFNWFHGRTRESVVRRELLFAEGSTFEEARIEETMRNLRGMGIFALVRITAVQGKRPGEVGVLVHTRDLWSLRIETDFNITSCSDCSSPTHTQINNLLIRATELNAFGHNKTVSADVTIMPKNYVITESYYARRVLGSSLAIKERAGLVFNRLWNNREGEVASVSLGQPFYRLSQRFGWVSAFSHDNRVWRNIRDGVTRRYPSPGANPPPYALQVYRARVQNAYLSASLRHGEQVKHTFSAGWDYRSLRASPTWETDLPESLREGFERDILPRERTDNGPTLSYELFVPSWVTFVNLATFGQSENVRVGPALTLATRVPLRAAGSSANAWVLSSTLGMTAAPRGYLVEARTTASARYQGRLLDQKATFLLRGATPIFSVFRFVMRAALELRRLDTQQTYVTLGADNGLRGHLSQELGGVGAHRVLANFELRSLPITWQAVHLGGVLFYDVGSVFYSAETLRLHHAIGVGVRLLFPQFNRQPFSFDGGMSFDPGFRFVPTITAGQVVPLTAAEEVD